MVQLKYGMIVSDFPMIHNSTEIPELFSQLKVEFDRVNDAIPKHLVSIWPGFLERQALI